MRTLYQKLGYCINFTVSISSDPSYPFSDTTALAILRIIRELVTNAIRHGKATSVKVAGCIEDDRLMFSVTDNGCGIEPASAPGGEQGHFGLQGVAERTERLNGELTVTSAPGRGTKALVSIVLHRKGDFLQ